MPPSNVVERVRGIHRTLAELGWTGREYPRLAVERFLMERYGINRDMATKYVKTGEGLGLWSLRKCRPAPGFIQVREAPSVPTHEVRAVSV